MSWVFVLQHLPLQENPDPRKYSTYLATRPPKFEEDAAHMLIDVFVEEHIPPTRGFYLHIAHLGDAKNIDAFRVRSSSSSSITAAAYAC
jgi:allantoinase